MSSRKKVKLVQLETAECAQHTIKVHEDLLHNVEQLCKTASGFTQEQNDDGVNLEMSRGTEGDGKISLALVSTSTKWRGLSEASAGARRQLEAEISRREQDIKALNAESEALRLRMERDDYEQEHDLGKELCQLHKMLGRHKEALQRLCDQSVLEIEADVDHVDRRLEITLSTLSRTSRQKAVVSVGNARLYVFGGYGNSSSADYDRLAATHCYDPKNDKWTRGASLTQSRSSMAGAALEGRLYAVGGLVSSTTRTTTAESLDVRQQGSKGWEAIAPVPHETVGFSALPFGRSLFVLGGSCRDKYVADVSRYDVVANSWSKAVSMSRPRGYFGGGNVGGHAYVFGGIDNNNEILDHAEKMDLEHDRWVAVPPLKIARWAMFSGAEGEVVRHRGVGCGGPHTQVGRTLRPGPGRVANGTDTNQVPLASVERYNEKQNAWKFVANLPVSLTLAGCAVA